MARRRTSATNAHTTRFSNDSAVSRHQILRGGDRPALDDVSLKIDKGEFVFLTGPSGAGKSTLLRLLYAAEVTERGQILVLGRTLSRLSRRKIAELRQSIGNVFQDFKLIPTRSVFDNVALALEVRGTLSSASRLRVKNVLTDLGIIPRANDRPLRDCPAASSNAPRSREHSSPIRACSCATSRLEISTASDRMEVMTVLQAAALRGASVVCATHDEALLKNYPQRTVAVWNAGRLVGDQGAGP